MEHKPGELFNAHKEMAMKYKRKNKNWIAGAIKKPGALHAEMGVKQGTKIPAGRLAAAAKKGGKLGRRARLAETLKGLHHKKMGKKKKLDMGGAMKSAGQAVGNWAKAGMPLPGAVKPNPGFTYLRGAQVKMPKYKKMDSKNCRMKHKHSTGCK